MENKDSNYNGLDTMIFLRQALTTMQNTKPNDRTERDRAYAVAMTELQKVLAWVQMYCLTEEEKYILNA